MKRKLGGWLYGIATRSGRRRWAALAIAALLCVLSVWLLSPSGDYRRDPSALVPRSADVYAEARNLPELLKTAGAWKLWAPSRRSASADAPGAAEKELAAAVSARVGSLPVAPVLRWMTVSEGAAWCVSRDEAGAESWALFLRMEKPETALTDVEAEPGVALEVVQGSREAGADGVFSLAGKPGGAFFGIVGPWLIVSGDAKLPEFAMAAKRRVSVSLAASGMLSPWRRSAGLRGMLNPAASADAERILGAGFVADWLEPSARVAFTASFGTGGGVEAEVRTVLFSENAPGGGLWPVVFVCLLVVAIASLCVVVSILLVMIGFGGWLKAMALRAGVIPADAPEKVEVSEAFREDSGERGDAQKDEEKNAQETARETTQETVRESAQEAVPEREQGAGE